LADINNRLEDYIKDKDKSELIEESKINHLRAAIAANMTGVIYHLLKIPELNCFGIFNDFRYSKS